MKTTTVFGVLALVLATLALAIPFWLNRMYPWVPPDSFMLRQQGIATSLPFLGVAVLALLVAMARRGQPDVRLPLSLVILFIVLLVVSGCWLLLHVVTWGM
jgi:hypothetical protein